METLKYNILSYKYTTYVSHINKGVLVYFIYTHFNISMSIHLMLNKIFLIIYYVQLVYSIVRNYIREFFQSISEGNPTEIIKGLNFLYIDC